VHSLCIADQLGVLKSIEHIAKTLHAENQPPPQPYVSIPKPRQSSKSQQSVDSELGSKSLTPESTGLEIATLNGDPKGEQGMRTYIFTGEELQSTTPLQSQSVSTDLESDNNIIIEPKFIPSHAELQVAKVVTDTGLRMFGIGAGTFMY
jgi:hypothetical protein